MAAYAAPATTTLLSTAQKTKQQKNKSHTKEHTFRKMEV